jgi:glycosyltransferase involved in cell wall biosynthesis
MTRYHFAFVIEQGLGHLVHGMNLEKVLESEPDIDATVLRVRPGETPHVHPLPFVRNWSIQMSWAARCSLRSRLQGGPLDAVFIHTQVAALFAKSIMREVPTIVSLDATPLGFDTMAGAYGHVRQSAPLERTKLWINRRAFSTAAAIVTWSPWAARSVVEDYLVPADRVHPIYPGVDVTQFRPSVRPDHPGPVRILFVGGDFVRKGGTDLTAAVTALDGAAELDIVSASRDISIPRGAPIRVHGNVSPNSTQLSELYARADIFALPSRGESLGLVIAEAMACGLPIVATSVGGISDMVQDGHNGILVPPAKPAELVSALRTMVSDGDLRRSMGAAGRELAEKEHDAAKNWQRIFDLMRAHPATTASGRTSVHRLDPV